MKNCFNPKQKRLKGKIPPSPENSPPRKIPSMKIHPLGKFHPGKFYPGKLSPSMELLVILYMNNDFKCKKNYVSCFL